MVSDDGLSAYAGQALVEGSCGYRTFCHSADASGTARLGAPAGLDFDLHLASVNARGGDPDRLLMAQRSVLGMRGAIWSEVTSGRMPPGAAGAEVIASPLRPRHATYASGVMVGALPELSTAEGREILRNWLACGAPVVERSEPRSDGMAPTVGDVVETRCAAPEECPFPARARCDAEVGRCGRCTEDADCAHLDGLPLCSAGVCAARAEPTWASIHAVVIESSCALSFCHGDPNGMNEAGLDLRGVSESYARLSVISTSDECGALGLPIVAPGDPDGSLLFAKLTATGEEDEAICGFRMPYSADALPEQWIEAIGAWIEAGAPGP